MSKPEEYTGEVSSKNEFLKNIFEILESLVMAIVCVVVLFTFVARLSIVDGQSMNPTLDEKDFLIVSDPFFTYQPKNGDIVVIHPHNHNPIVKRVIATEGQEIKFVYSPSNLDYDGVFEVYVDGEKLDESYVQYIFSFYDENGQKKKISYIPPREDSFVEVANGSLITATATVPEGCVFVMGDNRNNSLDSRSNNIGFIKEELILGKVVFRLLPFQKIGIIK